MLVRDEICLEKVRLVSKMMPRLRADGVGIIGGSEGREREGLDIFDSCTERPISMNSVLDGFKERRLVVIQDEITEIVFWR